MKSEDHINFKLTIEAAKGLLLILDDYLERISTRPGKNVTVTKAGHMEKKHAIPAEYIERARFACEYRNILAGDILNYLHGEKADPDKGGNS